MKKNAIGNRTLCLNFCSYYKPGKNEELACRGYQVVERMIREGRSLDLTKADCSFDCLRAEAVVLRMCVHCDFQKDGCDFMLDRQALPCGGFILLAKLLESGAITIEDVS
jgi:hypothetical protein